MQTKQKIIVSDDRVLFKHKIRTKAYKKYRKIFYSRNLNNYVVLKYTDPFDRSKVFEFDTSVKKKFYRELVSLAINDIAYRQTKSPSFIEIIVGFYDIDNFRVSFRNINSLVRLCELTEIYKNTQIRIKYYGKNSISNYHDYEPRPYTRYSVARKYKIYEYYIWVAGCSKDYLMQVYKYLKPDADVIEVFHYGFLDEGYYAK